MTREEEGKVKASAFHNKTVVSLGDGTRAGNVRDLLIDSAELRVAALVLAGDRGISVLPFSSIAHIGPDAITIDSLSDLVKERVGPEDRVRSLDELHSLPVVTVDGSQIGEVRDLDVDEQDGRLLSLEVHQGGVLGMGGKTLSVPAADIAALGPRVATLRRALQEEEHASTRDEAPGDLEGQQSAA
jgi:sporulation protein YlmC with PRC-barrel domain